MSPNVDVTPIRNPLDVSALEKFLSRSQSPAPLATQASTKTPTICTLGPSVTSWPPPFMKAPFTVKQFKFGQSNPTYFVTDANSRYFVLRRKPSPNNKLVSRSAHAIEREFFMLRAINICNEQTEKAGGPASRLVPVPKVHLLCEDESVLGYVFYLMEFVDGRQLKNPSMPGMPQDEQNRHWQGIMETITAIHSLDAKTLSDELPASHFPQFQPEKLFKTGGQSYFQRQARTLSSVEALQTKTVDPIPSFGPLCQWVLENGPRDPDTPTLIHGDFKIDNVIFHPTEPRVVAVLDWELCTFGHPIFDLANFLQPFQLPNQLNLLLYKPDVTEMGIEQPGSLEAVHDKLRLYREVLGHDWSDHDKTNNPVDNWDVGFVFGLLRLCVISQGIAMRVKRGSASSGEASGYARMYPLLSKLAVEYVKNSKKGKTSSVRL
ncbi:hypothetical protein CAAN1_20S02630 [[Candida] anglica]|uniref:Aminoglycoside phosphotransferase domain-containing protein n=1 Tax=[Candida] anglica TaxID=148631 RepID=A0ABP0EH99_9ASCO